MFITSFNTAFESTTGWLLYLTCSFVMQYMTVGYSLFHYLLLPQLMEKISAVLMCALNTKLWLSKFIECVRSLQIRSQKVAMALYINFLSPSHVYILQRMYWNCMVLNILPLRSDCKQLMQLQQNQFKHQIKYANVVNQNV